MIWDLETGGVEPTNPTIQLAAIAVRGWDVIDELEVKIAFDPADAAPEALAMNGYDADVWAREAIQPSSAIDRLDRWLQAHRVLEKVSKRTGKAYRVARVAGWNVRFDCERIERGFKNLDRFLPAQTFEALDLLQVARGYFWDRSDGPENHRLETVAQWFGIDTAGAHDALADCRLVLDVARRLKE